MDNMRALLDGHMEGQPSPSPLSALGLAHLDGPDLLQEKLEGREAPTQLPADGERAESPRRSPDFKDIKDAWREARQDRDESSEETSAPEKPDKPERTEPVAKEAKESKEDFEGFHVLNDGLQQTRQELQQLSQAQAQREREMQQWFQNQQRQAHATPQAPAIEEQLYQELGLADPQGLRAFADAIVQRTRQDQQAQYQQQVMPMLVQQQRDRFELAINRQKEALPEFDKYFNKQALNQLHETLIKSHGIQQVAGINWDQQLAQAYQSADYPRLKAELEKLEKAGKKEIEGKDKQKEKQKEKLGLVPKANVDNSGTGFHTWKKDIDSLPKSLSMKSFGREMLKIVNTRRA
jgi:hypothetical protein